MKKHKNIIIFIVLTVIILTLALLLFRKNKVLNENQIKIINASYSTENSDNCNTKEVFYKDDKYIYSFPCIQSSSTYVKFPNGNKMLVIKALEEKKVTIEELMKVYPSIKKDTK